MTAPSTSIERESGSGGKMLFLHCVAPTEILNQHAALRKVSSAFLIYPVSFHRRWSTILMQSIIKRVLDRIIRILGQRTVSTMHPDKSSEFLQPANPRASPNVHRKYINAQSGMLGNNNRTFFFS